MPTTVVLGLQWGDEGKGKIVDYLAEQAEMVARYQGGQNAGHTLVVDGKKTVTHLLPSGLLRGKPCLLGNGMVIDPVGLYEEMQSMPVSMDDLIRLVHVSDRAHMLCPHHKLIDARAHGRKIGTTGKGIGPAYMDKIGRRGMLMQALRDPERVVEAMREAYVAEGGEASEIADYLDQLKQAAAALVPLLTNSADLINSAYDRGDSIVIEGAQGTWLDIDHGTYPYVTSSSTTIGGACTGLGLPANKIDRVVGVVKAYTTRVGAGKHVTELLDETGDHLREKGQEYGATTGRPRRVGWLDLVAVCEAVRVNGVESIALTKLDILDELDTIRVAVRYKAGDQETSCFPSDLEFLDQAEPVYTELPGWKADTAGITRWEDLPAATQDYIRFIEQVTGLSVSIVSTGPGREATIFRI